jgi:hemerythrin-like domain-containing protein
MCDYCDCRSDPEIAALADDHAVIARLLHELGDAVIDDNREAATAVTARLHDILATHAGREEAGVFRALRDEVGDEYVDWFVTEHDSLHRLAAAVPTTSDWHDMAREIITMLSEHIAREESDLFPAAHQLLSPRQWNAVTTATTT